ncbi:MAG: alpha/beta hydrolase [Novosphingobium sp.]
MRSVQTCPCPAFQHFDYPVVGDVASREYLLSKANSDAGRIGARGMAACLNTFDNEQAAPSDGLVVSTLQILSQSDENEINLMITRPVGDECLPCVYYIHGGGMQSLSCYDGNYKAWARLIAANGVAVIMVDFRNALYSSSVPEVAPFPAGLNACLSGVEWVRENSATLNIDPVRIIITGESGGGNLTFAAGMSLKQSGKLGIIAGLYALCPYIAGRWPAEGCPSSIDNNGILLDLHNNRRAMAYGIEHLHRRKPLAWPSFAADIANFCKSR